jgi:perosamine synthetase
MIEAFIIPVSATLRDALARIDANSRGAAFIVDSAGVLVGVVTDGDVRRALLAGKTLETEVSHAMTSPCISLPVGADSRTIHAHLRGRIRIIPLVDGDGHPVDYITPWRHRMIPVAEPTLRGNEFSYVFECMETNWISSRGRFIAKFESDFSALTGANHAVAVSNGTAALHLALMASGIGAGDEVIVPDLTFGATAAAVVHAGAKPVLADVRRDTWCLDPDAFHAAITPRTRAVIPVHLYGCPAPMDSILDIAKSHGLLVFEDSAESLGAFYRGRHTGTLGDAGAFSFFGNKLITTGEGGMVLFKDPDAAERARRLRDHGMDPSRRYWHLDAGFNYRMTNIQAAIGVAQLEQIDDLIAAKDRIAARYNDSLSALAGVIPQGATDGGQSICWAYSFLVDPDVTDLDRDQFMSALANNGIDTRPVFYPLHRMPPYAGLGTDDDFPNAVAISDCGLSLPSAVTLDEGDQAHICATIRRLIRMQTFKKSLSQRNTR